MATEIERKFLLVDDSWRQQAQPGTRYTQGYLGAIDRASVRVRIAGDKAALNIKSATLGIQRSEYEYPIPPADAREMLEQLCTGPLIDKTRYLVVHAGHTWEIDEFHGDNAGLIVAELELGSADEAFARPAWLGAEVSEDPRYYNVNLVRHPYSRW